MAEIAYGLLYEDVYKNFISEAVKRSDEISFDVYWPEKEFRFAGKQEFLDSGLSEALYYSQYKHEEKLFLSNKEIFETECMTYLIRLENYLIGETCFSEKTSTYRLRSDSGLIPILQEPESLDNWGFPRYPDNISFIKDGNPWFYCTNHGTSNANLFPYSEADRDFWKELGILFL